MQINSYSPQITQNNRQKATNFGSKTFLPNSLSPHNGKAAIEILANPNKKIVLTHTETLQETIQKYLANLSHK